MPRPLKKNVICEKRIDPAAAFFYSRAFFFVSAPSPRMTFPREKNVAMKNAASPVRFWVLSF